MSAAEISCRLFVFLDCSNTSPTVRLAAIRLITTLTLPLLTSIYVAGTRAVPILANLHCDEHNLVEILVSCDYCPWRLPLTEMASLLQQTATTCVWKMEKPVAEIAKYLLVFFYTLVVCGLLTLSARK